MHVILITKDYSLKTRFLSVFPHYIIRQFDTINGIIDTYNNTTNPNLIILDSKYENVGKDVITLRDKKINTPITIISNAIKNHSFLTAQNISILSNNFDESTIRQLLNTKKNYCAESVIDAEYKAKSSAKQKTLLVGSSMQIMHLREKLQVLSHEKINVHIMGETGTGKELVAKSLAQDSKFVTINCSILNNDLGFSKIFGYTKGSFTGATANFNGILEEANGGTLFLDEVENLSLEIQNHLLRVLDNGYYFKIGEQKQLKTHFRLLTASNKNLKELVQEGKFRRDFYFRIKGAPIMVPPLRNHIEDLEELILLRSHTIHDNRPMNQAGIEILKTYPFPGNVRELNSIIDYCSIISSGNYLYLPQDIICDLGLENNRTLQQLSLKNIASNTASSIC